MVTESIHERLHMDRVAHVAMKEHDGGFTVIMVGEGLSEGDEFAI